jgi:hypothetical protein
MNILATVVPRDGRPTVVELGTGAVSTMISTVWRNLPPALAYICRRPTWGTTDAGPAFPAR